jgi:hypothetical protein
MKIVASVRSPEPGADASGKRRLAPSKAIRAYRARIAALRTTAPDTLRERIRRELRAAADPASRR